MRDFDTDARFGPRRDSFRALVFASRIGVLLRKLEIFHES